MEEFEHGIAEILKAVWDMISSLLAAVPTILKFIFWAVSAVFILPCVFVAGHLYPMWVEWGEEF